MKMTQQATLNISRLLQKRIIKVLKNEISTESSRSILTVRFFETLGLVASLKFIIHFELLY